MGLEKELIIVKTHKLSFKASKKSLKRVHLRKLGKDHPIHIPTEFEENLACGFGEEDLLTVNIFSKNEQNNS